MPTFCGVRLTAFAINAKGEMAMNHFVQGTGWVLAGALGLALINPVFGANTDGTDLGDSETPARALESTPTFSPADIRLAAETTRPIAPHLELKPVKPLVTAIGLTIISPNGGESFTPGSRVQVQWHANGVSGTGAVYLLLDGRKMANIATSVNLSAGVASWRVPQNLKPGGGYTVQIQSRDKKFTDSSDRAFTIGTAAGTDTVEETPPADTPAPSLSFIIPSTNTAWCTNQAHEFRWSSTLPAGSNITIELMRSDGTTLWQTIATNTPDDGHHTWPGLTDAQFSSGSISLRPRIRSTDNSVVKIGEPMHFGKPLMINAPQSNHTWRKGSPYTIRWTQLCELPAPAILELLDAGQKPVLTIAEGLPAAGNHMPRWYEWTVPADLAPGTYHIRVRTADNQLVRTGAFTIANPISFPISPDLTFTSPSKDAAWCTNLPHEFRWNSNLPTATRVRIDLMEANGEEVWRTIATDLSNSGSYAWNGYTDAQFGFGIGSFRPRIATMDNNTITVGERFHIGKHLFLDAPKSNYTWRHGASYDILWTQLCDLPAPISLELLDTGKQPVATLVSGLGTTGSSGRQIYKWTVPNTLAPGTYYIRVRTADGQYMAESSFAIAAPSQF